MKISYIYVRFASPFFFSSYSSTLLLSQNVDGRASSKVLMSVDALYNCMSGSMKKKKMPTSRQTRRLSLEFLFVLSVIDWIFWIIQYHYTDGVVLLWCKQSINYTTISYSQLKRKKAESPLDYLMILWVNKLIVEQHARIKQS